jgi:hypothetical protein
MLIPEGVHKSVLDIGMPSRSCREVRGAMERIDTIGFSSCGPPGSMEIRRIGLFWRRGFCKRRRRSWFDELNILEGSQRT